jgi:8-oxo-dGTP pyrophosphatase MutT (NUDIX family)
MRVTGFIIKDANILLMHRIKEGRDYFVFPGGSIEENESEEAALVREIKEETGLTVISFKKLFNLENQGKDEVYFLINEFEGQVALGGPEKERMNEDNVYELQWLDLSRVKEMDNLYPHEAIDKMIDFKLI